MNMVQLNNGIKMPIEGMGVFQITNEDICEQGCITSFKDWLSYD